MFGNKKDSPLIDTLIYFGGIIGPVMTVPQLYKIWSTKNATGVSFISWAAYAIGSAFWVWYGITHKQKPLIITYGLFLIIEILIVIGTFLFS